MRCSMSSAVIMSAAALVFLGAVLIMPAPANGALLPWFGGGRSRHEAAEAAPLSEVEYFSDPFKILEHIPLGFDRDDVALMSMARVDWRETPDSHEIVVDVPGIGKGDLKIEIDENRVLRIIGERRREEEEKVDHWHRVERSYGKFLRQFRLPDNADLDTITASLDHGVLTVRVKKLAPDQIKGPREVSIAGAGDDGAKKIAAGEESKKVEL